MSPVVKKGWWAALAVTVLLGGCSTAEATGRHAGAAGVPAPPAAGTAAPTITRLWHWGSSFGGTPGNVDTLRAPAPVTLPGAVAEVGSSNSTEYALLTDGRLYAWGLGTQGQLGGGRWADSLSRPVQVRFPPGVRIASIPTDAMPFDTGLAVDTTGHVWGWGHNGGGELCLGTTRSYATPVRLPLSGVTTLAGASTHAVYDAHGTVYACGQNIDGDLGTGSTRDTTTPQRVAGLPGGAVTRLVASFANSGALLSDGSLWAWGDDHAGQLGNGTLGAEPAPVRSYPPGGMHFVALATGSATSYALTAAGQVYAWGVGYVGQLGDGYTSPALAPVLVAGHATAISATANNVVIGAAAVRR